MTITYVDTGKDESSDGTWLDKAKAVGSDLVDGVAGIPDAAASAVSSYMAPPLASLGSLLTRGDKNPMSYDEYKQALTHQPTTRMGKGLLDTLGLIPNHTIAPVVEAVGDLAHSIAPGSIRSQDAQDALNTALPALAGPIGDLTAGTVNAVTKPFRAPVLARNIVRANVGEANIPKVIDALQNVDPILQGGAPTAADAVAGMPEGSPITAMQQQTFQQPGGPSVAAGKVVEAQNKAIQQAIDDRTAITDKLRQQALNSTGPVNPHGIYKAIFGVLQDPALRASSVVKGSMIDIAQKIKRESDVNGTINPNSLYTIRKELGNDIDKYSKENSNWDKKLTGGLVNTLQGAIDNAISDAGAGSKWQQYLDEYSNRSKLIEKYKDRQVQGQNPAQNTSIPGVQPAVRGELPKAPSVMSTPAVAANYLVAGLARLMKGSVNEVTARWMRNPQEMAADLKKLTPPKRKLARALAASNPTLAAMIPPDDQNDD